MLWSGRPGRCSTATSPVRNASSPKTLTSTRLVTDLERMGDLALHVAKVARMRFPEIAVPEEVRDVISQMGSVALSLVGKVTDVIKGRDVALAQAIEAE